MGTRGLTMVIMDHKTYVAQYGQWDHYPGGMGTTILKFLQKVDWNKFKAQLRKCRFSTKEDQKAMQEFAKSLGSKDGWMTDKQSEKFHKRYPWDDRDHGGKILEMINDYQGEDEIVLEDSSSFIKDSLFCEWAYVIDLDKQTFEVYKGFITDPIPKDQRFGMLKPNKSDSGGTQYFPCALAKEYKLSDLPSEDQFLEDLEEKDDE